VERRERERQVLGLDLLMQPPQLRLEGVDRDLELRERDDVLVAAAVPRERLVELGERLLRIAVHAHREHVVQELVARRPLDRPVAQLFAGLEDLLGPDVLDARLRQPLEVLGRVSEAVGMVDPHAVDHAFAHELDHLRMCRPEDLPVLLLEPTQLADVEEAAVEARLEVDVEEHLAQVEVAPERALVDRRHVVRDDVEDHAEPCAGELAELLLTAERLGDLPRVDHVVPVLRPLARAERRREIEVRDPEVAQVRNELPGGREAELGRQLQAVGRPEVRHASALRSSASRPERPRRGRGDRLRGARS
jgi:hypothetical protein